MANFKHEPLNNNFVLSPRACDLLATLGTHCFTPAIWIHQEISNSVHFKLIGYTANITFANRRRVSVG